MCRVNNKLDVGAVSFPDYDGRNISTSEISDD